MVVVTSRREESGRGTEVHHQIEADHFPVEAFGLGQPADLEVDVADGRARRQALPRRRRLRKLAQEVVHVQGDGPDLYLSAPVGPLLTGTVAVKLDPVTVGIGQVDRLADVVVGETLEGGAGLGQVVERARQRRPVWKQNGEVVKAGRRPLRAAGTGIAVQAQQGYVAGAERGDAVRLRLEPEADPLPVKGQGTF